MLVLVAKSTLVRYKLQRAQCWRISYGVMVIFTIYHGNVALVLILFTAWAWCKLLMSKTRRVISKVARARRVRKAQFGGHYFEQQTKLIAENELLWNCVTPRCARKFALLLNSIAKQHVIISNPPYFIGGRAGGPFAPRTTPTLITLHHRRNPFIFKLHNNNKSVS